jgi:hypothetical protein
MNQNLHIVERMLEIAKNTMEFSIYPKTFKEEHIFLSNILNDSKQKIQVEFDAEFKKAVGQYKLTLKEKKGYGWFHSPERIVWLKTRLNQLTYIIYGENYIKEIIFNDKLGDKAYKDLINQIDSTALMNTAQLKKHNADIARISKDIMKEILADEKNK